MMLKKINRTTRRQGKNLPTEKQKKKWVACALSIFAYKFAYACEQW